MNASKKDEEGEFREEQLLWGLHMDFGRATVRLPEPKCVKGQYLLALPELQAGCTQVRLKVAQELRGSAQFWSSAQPAISTELAVMDRMLVQDKKGSSWVCPPGGAEALADLWEEWHLTLELFRIMFADPLKWSTNFQAAFAQMLSPRERMALPGQGARVRWTGGDATLESVGAVDWGSTTKGENPKYMATTAGPLLEQLKAEADWVAADEPAIIAVVELLAFIILAAARGDAWQEELVFYVSDNENVKAWLNKRRPKNQLARHLIRLLSRLEALHGFSTTCFYIRTYHNRLADWLTREELKKVHEEMEDAGWTRLEPPEAWGKTVGEVRRRLLKLPGEKGSLAEAAELHWARRFPERRYKEISVQGTALELGDNLRHYAAAWRLRGGSTADKEPCDPRWIFCTFTEDPGGRELQLLVETTKRLKPAGILSDAPRGADRGAIRRALAGIRYGVVEFEVLCSELGDGLAKTRFVILAIKGRQSNKLEGTITGPEVQSHPEAMLPYLAKEDRLPDEVWLLDSSKVTWDPRMSTSGKRSLPWPVGSVKIDGQKWVVHSTSGPACTSRWPGDAITGVGGTLIRGVRENTGKVRRLISEEVWALHGGSLDDWTDELKKGTSESALLKRAVASMPPRSADRLVHWAEEALRGEERGDYRAGQCPDPEERAAWATVQRWLRAWKKDPSRPSRALEDGKPTGEKVGGTPKKPRRQKGRVQFDDDEGVVEEIKAPPGEALSLESKPTKRLPRRRKSPGPARRSSALELVKPSSLKKTSEEINLDLHRGVLQLGGSGYREWLEEQKMEALMQKLAEGTRNGYEVGWKQWVLFRREQGLQPFLTGGSRAQRQQDEDSLVTFAVFLARVMGRQTGTIKQRLFAVRYAHLTLGYEDPLLHKARLWTSLEGLHRWIDNKKRKKPVTTRMLRWLKEYLRERSGLSRANRAAIWLGLMLAFFFLLRASEYMVQSNRSWSRTRVVRGVDLAARKQNLELTSFKDAEEIVLHITGSKTDQYNVGEIRNQYATGLELDPVKAAWEFEREFPERLRGSEKMEPLLRYEDGSAIQRTDIQHYLRLAAWAEGWDEDDIGSHSLRIGGATAMYHTVQDLEKVKRFGRWSSDAFHGYLWESHEQMVGVAAAMAADNTELTKPAGS